MYMRPDWCGHAIGRNHACMRPSRFVFVDVETKQTEVKAKVPYLRHELQLGVACYVHWKKRRGQRDEWFDFTDGEQFWQWLATKQCAKSVVWVVAHNSLFDFTILGLWSRIECKHYSVSRPGQTYSDPRTSKAVVSKPWLGLLAIDGRPFHVETQGRVGRVNFTDLMNYYPVPLAEIARTVGLTKGKWQDVKDNRDALLNYCKVDVEITRRAYLGLVQQWEDDDNGNWKLSAAGLAWSNYRHRHYTEIIRVHEHAEARDLEWQSYFGGEVRCYFRGPTQIAIRHYDVNSLYPYVMSAYEYPTELIDYIVCPKPGIVEHLLRRFACIAEVTLETDVDHYPVRATDRIVYPVGRFRTSLCGPELYDAWHNGRIRETHRLAYYLQGKLFETYVNRWWGGKRAASESGDSATERFCKLILNSLQGKFAQRTPIWEVNPRIEVVRPWTTFPYRNPDTQQITPARSIGWLGQQVVQRSDKAHAFPAISAYICAYARHYMRSYRNHIPPSMVYYQDTDSLMLDASYDAVYGANPLPISANLGGFRQVGVYESVDFRGPKNYSTDSKRVIAGIKDTDLKIGATHFVGSRFERTSAIVTREPDCTIREHTQHFDMPGQCNEGGYRADGWSYPLIRS